ncbi:MAG: preprotein translocase subunit YajC [Phycisphaeraceae bacterium]
MFEHIPLILAQEDVQPIGAESAPPAEGAPNGEALTGQDGSPGGAPPARSPFGFGGLLPLIIIFGLFWFILMGGQRKEKKKRAAMLAALAKGDKVQTAGGVLGTVVEVRDSDVVVKVDENANIRLRFARTAIQSIIKEDD